MKVDGNTCHTCGGTGSLKMVGTTFPPQEISIPCYTCRSPAVMTPVRETELDVLIHIRETLNGIQESIYELQRQGR